MPYAFELDCSVSPPICLPTWLVNRGRLIDVTQPHHAFRVFFDPAKGETHNGAEYFKESQLYGLIN